MVKKFHSLEIYLIKYDFFEFIIQLKSDQMCYESFEEVIRKLITHNIFRISVKSILVGNDKSIKTLKEDISDTGQ